MKRIILKTTIFIIALTIGLVLPLNAYAGCFVDSSGFMYITDEDDQGDNTAAVVTYKVYYDKPNSYSGYNSSLPTLRANYANNSGSTVGSYPTRKGIILVTTDALTMNIGHSAIVYSSSQVVESTGSGVVVGNNNWSSAKNDVAAVTARGTSKAQDTTAANWCYSSVGKSYNFNFYNMANRSKFYCSHLIWASFYDNYLINLNTSHYDINSSDKTAIGPNEFVRVATNRLFITYLKNWTNKDYTTNSTIY